MWEVIFEIRLSVALKIWRQNLAKTQIYNRNMDARASQMATYIIEHRARENVRRSTSRTRFLLKSFQI